MKPHIRIMFSSWAFQRPQIVAAPPVDTKDWICINSSSAGREVSARGMWGSEGQPELQEETHCDSASNSLGNNKAKRSRWRPQGGAEKYCKYWEIKKKMSQKNSMAVWEWAEQPSEKGGVSAFWLLGGAKNEHIEITQPLATTHTRTKNTHNQRQLISARPQLQKLFFFFFVN